MPDAHRDEIDKLETLYAEHPEGRIFTHLAEAYRKAGEADRAEQVLRDGLQRHPEYSSAHVVLGRVLMDRNRTDEARSEFDRVLELDPHNLVALRALGDLAHGDGRVDDALAFYQRLLEVEPSEEVRDLVDDLTGPAPAGMEIEPATEPATEPAEPASDLDSLHDLPAMDWPPPGAEPEAEPGFDLGVELDAEAADEPEYMPSGGSPDVMTETIAQVYARQGLYDRAAEVYRELARSRPDDETLRARLEEMEALAREQGDEPAEDEPASGEIAPLAGFESGELDATPADIEPLAGLEADEEPVWEMESEAGEDTTVPPLPELESEGAPDVEADVEPLPELEAEPEPTEFGFDGPLPGEATQPWLETEEPASTEEAETTEWEEPAEAPEPEPWLETPAPEPWTEAPAAAAERDGQAEAPAAEAPREEPPQADSPEEAPPEEEPEPESPWVDAADWGAPPAETPYAWGEADVEEDGSPPIGGYFSSLLEWSPGTGGEGAESGEAAEPAESGESREPGEPTPGDDDLDTFRTWLESLKR